MADELEASLNEPSDAEKRIKQLSGKVKEEAEAREAALKAQAEAQTKAEEAEKRAAFAEGFADVVAQNPAAKDFRADIQQKVMSGYTLEDATFAVLGKAGKITPPQAETESPAGGSSPTNPSNVQVNKSPREMNSDELQAAMQAANDSGELYNYLARGRT